MNNLNIIYPLYNLGEDIKIKNDYVVGDNKLFKYHYYLDVFKYEVEVSNIGCKINLYYGVGKVNTIWYRECELLTSKRRKLDKILETIKTKYKFTIGEKVSLGTKFQRVGEIMYNSGIEYGKIEKFIISGIMEYKYHPKTGEKLKDLFIHESIKLIINGKEYIPSEITKEPI